MDLDPEALSKAGDLIANGDKSLRSVVGIIDSLKKLTTSSDKTSADSLKPLVAELTMQVAEMKLTNAGLMEELAVLQGGSDFKNSNACDVVFRFDRRPYV